MNYYMIYNNWNFATIKVKIYNKEYKNMEYNIFIFVIINMKDFILNI